MTPGPTAIFTGIFLNGKAKARRGLSPRTANPFPAGSLLLLLLMACVMAGCGKKSDSGARSAKATNSVTEAKGSGYSSGNPITAPVDYLGAVGAAKKVGERTADTAPLTQAVSRFLSAEGRLPKGFPELVEEGYLDKEPVPPRGMRYVFDQQRGAVRLVPAQ